jgi:hypothetical protein
MTPEPLATPEQVSSIVRLIAARRRDEDLEVGFYQGPTVRSEIEQLTAREAETYIDSLTGNY